MSNALSPFLSNVFLRYFEKKLSIDGMFPRVYWRYMDDVIAVVKSRNIQKTLEMLNSSRYPSIRFTVEEEKDDDVAIRRKEDGSVKFSIFRKPNWTGRCITSESFHSYTHKMASLHSMANRLMTIPMEREDFNKEYKKIIEIGELNGYSKHTVCRIIEKHRQKQHLLEVTTLTPFPKEETKNNTGKWKKKIQAICMRSKVEVVSASNSYKLKRNLTGTKDPKKDEDKAGIYTVECQDGCDADEIITRFKEYMAHFRKNEDGKSCVADHCLREIHFTNAGKLKLVKEITQPEFLDMNESIEIAKRRHSTGWLINNDDGPIDSVITRAFW